MAVTGRHVDERVSREAGPVAIMVMALWLAVFLAGVAIILARDFWVFVIALLQP